MRAKTILMSECLSPCTPIGGADFSLTFRYRFDHSGDLYVKRYKCKDVVERVRRRCGKDKDGKVGIFVDNNNCC